MKTLSPLNLGPISQKIPNFTSASNLPTASQFGVGVAQVGNDLIVSNGVNWKKIDAQGNISIASGGEAGSIIDQCTSLTGWTASVTGTITVDTVHTLKGQNTIKLVCGAGSGNAAHITKTVAIDAESTDTFGVWIYIKDQATLTAMRSSWGAGSYVQMYLSENSGFTSAYTLNLWGNQLASSATYAVGWNFVNFIKSDAGVIGTPSPTWASDFVRLRIYASHPTGFEINVGPIVFGAKQKPIVMIGFDDGYDDAYHNAYRYLIDKGLLGYLAIPKTLPYIPNLGYATIEQIDDVYNAGWEILNHSNQHVSLASVAVGSATTIKTTDKDSAAAVDTAMWEVETAREWLKNMGWTRGLDCLVYPLGGYTDALMAELKLAGFKYARAAHQGVYSVAAGDQGILHNLNSAAWLCGVGAGNINTVAQAIAKIDRAVASGGVIHFYIHKVNDNPTSGNWDTTNFRAMIDYVVSLRDQGFIEVATPSMYIRSFAYSN